MDIYLSEVANKSSDFTFPALPEKIKTKFGTRYQTYEIIGKGTVKIPKGLEADTISWDGIFTENPKEEKSRFVSGQHHAVHKHIAEMDEKRNGTPASGDRHNHKL